MQESQENNSKPPAWRLFYLYLQLTLIYHSIHCIYSVLIGVFMSNELDSLSEVVKGLTKIELPGGGGGETDSPVVEAAIAVGIVGAAAYGIYKLFGRAEPRQPGGCKLKTAPVRPVVAARPAEYVCSEDLFY